MSGPTPIHAETAIQTRAPVDVALIWTCPACGQIRAYEGGRPGEHDECEACGCRVAPQAPTKRPVASTSRYLF